MARLVKLSATGPVKVEPSDKPTFVYDENGQRHPAPKA